MLFVSILTSRPDARPGTMGDHMAGQSTSEHRTDRRVQSGQRQACLHPGRGESVADTQFMDRFNDVGVLETSPAFDRTAGWRAAFAKDIDTFRNNLMAGRPSAGHSVESTVDPEESRDERSQPARGAPPAGSGSPNRNRQEAEIEDRTFHWDNGRPPRPSRDRRSRRSRWSPTVSTHYGRRRWPELTRSRCSRSRVTEHRASNSAPQWFRRIRRHPMALAQQALTTQAASGRTSSARHRAVTQAERRGPLGAVISRARSAHGGISDDFELTDGDRQRGLPRKSLQRVRGNTTYDGHAAHGVRGRTRSKNAANRGRAGERNDNLDGWPQGLWTNTSFRESRPPPKRRAGPLRECA